MMAEDASSKHPVNRPPHPLEWIIGAASGLAVVALIAYLAITALTETDGPPAFELSLDDVFEGQGLWHARVTVRNFGHKTAADVVLEGALPDQTSEITFDYVPAGSSRTGALLFDRRPEGLALQVRSYTDP